MCVKHSPGDLNPDLCPSQRTSTYNCKLDIVKLVISLALIIALSLSFTNLAYVVKFAS